MNEFEMVKKADVMRIINAENAVALNNLKERSMDEVLCAIASQINSLQTIQTTIEADIDRAEIMRLCNEIEDVFGELCGKYEFPLYYYSEIMKRLKAIGKELTGNEQL